MWGDTNHTQYFIQWLAEFFRSRHLYEPDGRPLFEYQTSFNEYQQLKHLFAQPLTESHFVHERCIAACFVLFCAEWYRREYRSTDGWSWESIWHQIGCAISANQRGKVVTIGLQEYWQREISTYETTHRNLLGSIFREGGLPFRSLKDSGNRFHVFFARVLAALEDYRNLGYSHHRLVADMVQKARLPRVFSEETSIDFLASMANELAALVATYELGDKQDPARALDRLKPDWRDVFPIPLDADTGREFINALLLSASQEAGRSNKQSLILSCNHYFPQENYGQFVTHIELPKILHVPTQNAISSSRLELAVFEGDVLLQDLGPAYAEITDYGLNIRNRITSVQVKRDRPSRNLYLVFTLRGARVGRLAIPDSFIDVGVVPLGFQVDDGNIYNLVGQASFSARLSSLILWVPAAAQLELLQGDYQQLGRFNDCNILQLGPESTLRVYGDEVFRISLGASHHHRWHLDLQGNSLPWPSSPSAVYCGPPAAALAQSNKEKRQKHDHPPRLSADIQTLDPTALQLYVSGQKFCPHDEEHYGVHYIALRNTAGEAVLRRKAGILPDDFQLELMGGDRPNEGSIWIKSALHAEYEILDSTIESYPAYDENHPDYSVVGLVCQGYPPPNFKLSLRFGTTEPITITLPFPSSGFLAFDAQGQRLPREVSVDNLLGTRLHLFANVNTLSTTYLLALTLRDENRLNLSTLWEVRVEQEPIEISLFSLRDTVQQLLSLQRGIDPCVDLTVNNRLVCQLRRYDIELDLDILNQRLRYSRHLSNAQSLPKPVMVSLTEPERRPIKLVSKQSQNVALGEYALPSNLDLSHTWLVVPCKKSTTTFRPEIISLQAQDQDSSSAIAEPNQPFAVSSNYSNIRWAVRHHQQGASVGPLDQVIEQMATDATHRGWHYIRAIYDNYKYLPLAAFDSWLALMRNPRAIAMALFKFEMAPDLIERLAVRFPFAWELFPIRKFALAETDFLRSIGSNFAEEEKAERLLDIKRFMYSRLVDAVPAYSTEILSCLSEGHLGGQSNQNTVSIETIRPAIYMWRQELLTRRVTTKWPTSIYDNKLKKWALTQDLCVFETEHDDRNLVAYMPYFAAAVAAGKTLGNSIFAHESELIFYLRQARDFEIEWFYGVYRYALSSYLNN